MDRSFGFTTIAVVAPSDLLGYCASMGLSESNCTIEPYEGTDLAVLVANELIDWEDAREQFHGSITEVQYKLVNQGNAKRRGTVREAQLPEVGSTRSKAPANRRRSLAPVTATVETEAETVA